MKTIFKIAKTELQVLFYSPIAWLILVIFAFQANTIFVNQFSVNVRLQYLGPAMDSITLRTFSGFRGLFPKVSNQYLYFYIPLLTMGIMSREISRGSIKLLYSSPLTTSQIILGKYFSLVFFCMILTMLLLVPAGFASGAIANAEVPVILSGLLGIFLLACTYASIGLFVSSLTSYSVVAAIGTLSILGTLSYTRNLWQEVPFVRDVTYWLAMSGRTETLINGLITLQDLLYFLIVITLFIGFSIIKLENGRKHSNRWYNFSRYASVFVGAMLLGYLSSRPSMQVMTDLTRGQNNTLSRSSQQVMAKMNGDLKITTYVNLLDRDYALGIPAAQNQDINRFSQYLRFKPDIKMEYVYYYQKTDNERLIKRYPNMSSKALVEKLSKIYDWSFDIKPYQQIRNTIDLSGERYHFVRVLERENGKRAFLRVFNDAERVPNESEITAAFKRLVTDLPIVGFVKGHGERDSNAESDRGYNRVVRQKDFRHAFINQGLDFTDVTLDKPLPADIRILVIAEPKTAFSVTELQNLKLYINRGGNLLMAGEPGSESQMNELTNQFGVQFLQGTLVEPNGKTQPDLLLLKPTPQAIELNNNFSKMKQEESVLSMPTAAALEVQQGHGFTIKTLFKTDSVSSWNRIAPINKKSESVLLKPQLNEKLKSYPTVLALSRLQNGRQQRIVISADADWLSNGEIERYRDGINIGNYNVSDGLFYWLTDNEVPIDMTRPAATDTLLNIGPATWDWSSVIIKWIIPLLICAGALLMWARRSSR